MTLPHQHDQGPGGGAGEDSPKVASPACLHTATGFPEFGKWWLPAVCGCREADGWKEGQAEPAVMELRESDWTPRALGTGGAGLLSAPLGDPAPLVFIYIHSEHLLQGALHTLTR